MTRRPPSSERTVAALLRGAGLDPFEARVLLRTALGVDDARLAAHPEAEVPPDACARFLGWAARRRAGEPVAYLVGEREFYGLPFAVSPAVLIPRPETELLVEAALERLPPEAPLRVLDLATGSGCAAVAIASRRPRARVTATDVSHEALAVARVNAARHGVAIEFVASDWFAALAGRRFDLIVANPPYVAEDDPHLAAGDLRFEPRLALAAGPKGLDALEAIIEHAPRHLAGGGWLLLEHGYEQAACVRALLGAAGFEDLLTLRDLAGHERVTGGLTARATSR